MPYFPYLEPFVTGWGNNKCDMVAYHRKFYIGEVAMISLHEKTGVLAQLPTADPGQERPNRPDHHLSRQRGS